MPESPARPHEAPITMHAAPVRSDSVAMAEFDGESVLYDERDGAVHVLNATATLVWNALDGQITIGALIADLAEAFDVDEQTIAADVVAMAADLADKGLLLTPGAAAT